MMSARAGSCSACMHSVWRRCGDYAQAEKQGRRAVEMNAADGWAAHAVAHVCEMSGRTGEGVEWLEATSNGWAEQSFFAFHNWWHLALYRLETENYAGALGIYDAHIRAIGSRVAVEMVDASALLWRLRLRGVDVGERWNELADAWEGFGEDGYYAFNDVHAVMAFLATGRDASVRRVMASLEKTAARYDTNGMMSREVGLPVARALCAFERRDYEHRDRGSAAGPGPCEPVRRQQRPARCPQSHPDGGLDAGRPGHPGPRAGCGAARAQA